MAISIKSSATSTASTVTGPSDIVAGDLLILLDMALSFDDYPTLVTPSGFTSIGEVTVSYFNYHRQNLSYKIADGSEASASITGMNGNDGNRKCLLVVTGDGAITAVTPASYNEQGTNVDPTSQTVTSGSGAAPLIVIGGYGAASDIDPRTFSPAKDGEINPNGNLYLAYKIYNSSPSNVSIDMDDESAQLLQSCYIEVTETTAASIDAEAGSFTLTGIDATLTYAASNIITADVSSFVLTGIDVTLKTDRKISADVGAFVLTGMDTTGGVTASLSCSPGMFFLYGRDVTLTRSGGEAIDYGELLIPPNTVMADPVTGQIRPEWAKFLNDVRLRLNN